MTIKLIDWLMILNDEGYVSDELLNDLVCFTSPFSCIGRNDCYSFLSSKYSWSALMRATKRNSGYYANEVSQLQNRELSLRHVFDNHVKKQKR